MYTKLGYYCLVRAIPGARLAASLRATQSVADCHFAAQMMKVVLSEAIMRVHSFVSQAIDKVS